MVAGFVVVVEMETKLWMTFSFGDGAMDGGDEDKGRVEHGRSRAVVVVVFFCLLRMWQGNHSHLRGNDSNIGL